MLNFRLHEKCVRASCSTIWVVRKENENKYCIKYWRRSSRVLLCLCEMHMWLVLHSPPLSFLEIDPRGLRHAAQALYLELHLQPKFRSLSPSTRASGASWLPHCGRAELSRESCPLPSLYTLVHMCPPVMSKRPRERKGAPNSALYKGLEPSEGS